MTTIEFNGETYDGDMPLVDFCKSLGIRNYQFFAHPREFRKEKRDTRLMEICKGLNIQWIG